MSTLSRPDVVAAGIRLALDGELDLSNRDEFCDRVAATLRSRPSTIALDLSAVDFIDCAGLCGILRAHDLAGERNCQLVVSEMSATVRRLFTLTDTLSMLTPQPIM